MSEVLRQFLPFSFSAFSPADGFWFWPLLFSPSCSFPPFLLSLSSQTFWAPKLGQKCTEEECRVRYRRRSQHPFPLNFPCPPPFSIFCGLDQLKTKLKITILWTGGADIQHNCVFLKAARYNHAICIWKEESHRWKSVGMGHYYWGETFVLVL